MPPKHPILREKILTYYLQDTRRTLSIDTPAWECWLEEASLFLVDHERCSFTVRKERAGNRRGTSYWRAYRSYQGTLYRIYIGKTAELTFARLQAVALEFAHAQCAEETQAALSFREGHDHQQQAADPASSLLLPQEEKVEDVSWLLLPSKITIPPLRAHHLLRPRVARVLDQILQYPLTLLSAPAGFGKTTVLSEWSHQKKNQVIWLSLEEEENHLSRFWRYLLEALKASHPLMGASVLPLLQLSQVSRFESVLAILLQELTLLTEDIILVLDDYQAITEQKIHDALLFFLRHLPAHVHVVLATRHDPPLDLTRFRAHGQLFEVRSDHLRFTHQETALFVRTIIGMALTQEELEILHQRTEGWIGGIHLIALALGTSRDILVRFRGQHRWIADYLREEVLQTQPEAVQHFLLRTAILKQMNADMCQAVIGAPTRAVCQDLLETLERANLFLEPLDQERGWYRYHRLFRDVLLAQLQETQPTLLPVLHRRAASWYHAQGLMYEAIEHALAAPDHILAISFMEQIVDPIWRNGDLPLFLRWVQVLPESLVREHVYLALMYAWALFRLGQRDKGEALLRSLEQTLKDDALPVLSHSEYARFADGVSILRQTRRLTFAIQTNDKQEARTSLAHLQQATHGYSSPWKEKRLSSLGMGYSFLGDLVQAQCCYQDARMVALQAQNRFLAINALISEISLLRVFGHLHQAQQQCKILRQLIEQLGGRVPSAGYADLIEAWLFHEWNDLPATEAALLHAIEKAELWRETANGAAILFWSYKECTLLSLERGDMENAEQAFGKAYSLAQQTAQDNYLIEAAAAQVQCWLAQGDLASASRWVRQYPFPPETLDASLEPLYLTQARVAIAQQEYEPVVALLDALYTLAKQAGRKKSLIDILVLQVMMFDMLGWYEQAQGSLVDLLELTVAEGYIRPYLSGGPAMQQQLQRLLVSRLKQQPASVGISSSYIQRLLHAFPKEQNGRIDMMRSGWEALTEREMEVLSLLAHGVSNQAIAEQLVVSLATVKKHVHSILGKLQVTNRTQAIIRARDLKLI